ncbi:MAG: hypothetical protein FJ088_15030, partial [Deltaproteobacteria bacterium]|nr:hypothetical protein [Deltaproteobacteria bacterium]
GEEVIDLEGDDMRPKVNQQNGRILFRTCGGENCRAGVYLGAGLHYLIGSDKCVDTDPDWHTTNEGISYIVLSRKWKEGVGAPDPNQFHVILVSCSGYPYWRITPADKEDVGPSCCL